MIFKSIGAVAAGFFTVFILSVLTDSLLEAVRFFPPQNEPKEYHWWMLLIALIYRTLYTVLGGYITATLAPNLPMRHVLTLAGLGFVGALVGLLSHLDIPGLWYPIMLVVLAVPSVWFGGSLHAPRISQIKG